MGVRVADVVAVLDTAYPPALAQEWDSVGLVCGDPAASVESVTVAVDATAATVAETGAEALLLAHHPLLLRGVDTVAADTPKGALVHRLVGARSALFTAHTNADAAAPGVSDALAEALGLRIDGPLDPSPATPLDSWGVCVPVADAERVREALFAAGAGRIGDYARCSWGVVGTGQFLPQAGATPTLGAVGRLERVVEERVEIVAPASARREVLAALRAAHPYEEPAFDVHAMAPLPAATGIGRVGTLAAPETLAAFVARAGAALPTTTWGVRAAGDPQRTVRRVAVCGGAGDSLIGAAAREGVDAYLTADLRHHPADEALRRHDVALLDAAHWATEQPWCAQAARLLRAHFGDALSVRVSALRTDPWTLCSTIGPSSTTGPDDLREDHR